MYSLVDLFINCRLTVYTRPSLCKKRSRWDSSAHYKIPQMVAPPGVQLNGLSNLVYEKGMEGQTGQPKGSAPKSDGINFWTPD